MRNIQGLALADLCSDSLGRLNGQYPGLFYVACAKKVGVATRRSEPRRLYGGSQEGTYAGATSLYSIAASSVVSFFVRPRSFLRPGHDPAQELDGRDDRSRWQ